MQATASYDETYLLVESDEGGLELSLLVFDGGGEVVGELVVRVGHAGQVLGLHRQVLGRVRHGMKRHGLVLRVSDFL